MKSLSDIINDKIIAFKIEHYNAPKYLYIGIETRQRLLSQQNYLVYGYKSPDEFYGSLQILTVNIPEHLEVGG